MSSPSAPVMVRMGDSDEIGTGWRLIKFKAKDPVSGALLKWIASFRGVWDNVLRPKLEEKLSSNGYTVKLPVNNFFFGSGRFSPRKGYDEKTRVFWFWAKFTKAGTT